MADAGLEGIGAPDFQRWHKWIKKKRWQVAIRQHLSLALSTMLAFAVFVREGLEWREFENGIDQIKSFFMQPHPSAELRDTVVWVFQALNVVIKSRLPFFLFVFALVVATWIAALWERSPRKLATSPQEIRFLIAVRKLALQIEAMRFAGIITKEQAQERFSVFVKTFLRITSHTLCAHKKVEAGLLMKFPDERLMRTYVSDGAHYKVGFFVPLPGPNQPREKCGPGALSFHLGRIVYMPSVKKWKEAWPLLRSGEGKYNLEGMPLKTWVDAPASEQNFSSILCVPVGVDEHQNTRYGVLEFTTTAKDQFIDRDFAMAETFASILSQAAQITATAAKP